jgi:hypothetical protein
VVFFYHWTVGCKYENNNNPDLSDPMPLRQFLAETLEAAVRAVTMVILHTIVVSVIIGCAFLVEQFILLLWRGHEPAIMGVHMSEIVLGADIFLLFAFLVTASIRAILAFWR